MGLSQEQRSQRLGLILQAAKKGVTLNGKPARLKGAMYDTAQLVSDDGKTYARVDWETVAEVLQHCGAFVVPEPITILQTKYGITIL